MYALFKAALPAMLLVMSPADRSAAAGAVRRRSAATYGAGHVALKDVEPIVVSPRAARFMLSISNAKLYELIKSGVLASYRDGNSRKIFVKSIKKYTADRIAAANKGNSDTARRPRGRPRKNAVPVP
jgi:hypothetical protein